MKTLHLSTILTLTLIFAGVSRAGDQYQISSDSIMKHISILAHDSLEGRKVGEIGEAKASAYISTIFEKENLEIISDRDDYLIPFNFTKSIDFGDNNSLTINDIKLELGLDFYPFKNSANAKFDYQDVVFVGYGIKTEETTGGYNDYENLDVEGKAVVIMRYSPDPESNPHIDFDKYSSLSNKIATAQEHKAAAIFFATPDDKDDTVLAFGFSNITQKDIPIILLRHSALTKAGLELNDPAVKSLSGESELIKSRGVGNNVVGLLKGKTDSLVIIGAHYDHLGYGGQGSRYLGKEKQIHNGADDNGSGTAGLLELIRYFKSRQDEINYSILFLAFSGEESGLLGSGNFVKSDYFDKEKTRMMMNMDMIGRLKDQENGIAIFGTGTCKEFKEFFDNYTNENLKLTLKESGTGPSDHTAFYNRDVPVLHFFTGAHQDYHKPTDDIEFVDNEGIVTVVTLLADIVEHFDDENIGALTFQKTKDPDAGKRASRFSVTLGIMPDYIAEVAGLRVDGVTPDRPGEKAGLLSGDIITKIGTIAIGDIYDYMNALGKFRKGDSTQMQVVRDVDTLMLSVVF